MTISTKIQTSQVKKAREKTLKVGLLTYGNAPAFRDSLLNQKNLKIRENIHIDNAQDFIRQDSLDAIIIFSQDFDAKVSDMQEGIIKLYYKSTEDLNTTRRRLLNLIRNYEKTVITERFKKLNLDKNIVSAIHIETHDIASKKERIGKYVGGFLPYIFVLFCFLGCMYPAIDLGAGEKERGTLETLLASPASKLQILMGKLGVIVLTGIMSAIISMLGLFIAVQKATGDAAILYEVASSLLEFHVILLILSLLLPLTIFIASILLCFSIFAKSFKEAQSIISPLNIVIILPIFIGILPGVNLNTTTALIPILNVSLATKEIIAGTITPGLLAEVYISLVILAGLSITACMRWFEREETMFRGS